LHIIVGVETRINVGYYSIIIDRFAEILAFSILLNQLGKILEINWHEVGSIKTFLQKYLAISLKQMAWDC
jgi:hypothetical protein